MNKAELIEALANQMDSKKVDAERYLDAFIETVSTNLSKGNEVKLIGFGTFGVSSRKARMGHNPQTGEQIKIPARKVPVFKAGKELKEMLT